MAETATPTKPAAEPTAEQLKAELTAAKAEIARLGAQPDPNGPELTKLRAELSGAQELATLIKQHNAELEQQLSDAGEVIADLKEQLAEKPQGALPTITHEGVTYEVHATEFTFKGKLVTMSELKTDKSLVQALLDRKAGVLVKVVKAKKN